MNIEKLGAGMERAKRDTQSSKEILGNPLTYGKYQ